MQDPKELMAICDEYWSARRYTKARYERYVSARNDLHRHGRSLVPWARGLLQHSDYEARALGAGLLGSLAKRGLLRDEKMQVIAELGALARRPWLEDTKEEEANTAAVFALHAIGERAVVPQYRALICSSEPHIHHDTRWDAARLLGPLVGQDFASAPDPIAAASAWLESHPD